MKELKKDLSLNFRADRLDVAGLAQANGYVKGQDLLQKYERLKQESCRLEADLTDAEHVIWRADGEWIESAGEHAKVKPQVWLHLTAQTYLPQTCQRCLGEVSTLLEVERDRKSVV